ncbi:YydG family radical SAM peptide epimerase [Staphylococcus americanisciuri]|uniref:YydG family radical SAM peptide epimerase n=1 Tax=Staphylococcus americanisciuri TaxID=2973940 RepID=A0ABT2EZE3_9STAP|nr:YydG family radical SAM peptide epimerase [Staphylococcus americanisciuri]MCS4485590.1 YydG family radical SAM peptide epimerase [Staphylococcus americanisciuri]
MYHKSVSINLGSKCNASCSHCCFSCSPSSTLKMDDLYIKNLVLEFAKNPQIEVISFTGGEIFLNYPFLKELLTITSSFNKKVTLISNGFWGNSKKLLKQYFDDFIKYNVIALTISYDEYHEPFIKISSIKKLFEFRMKYPEIEVSLNMAVTKDKMSDDILKNLGSSILGVKITKFPMISVGAAKKQILNKNIHNFYNIETDKDLLYCPGYEIVYHHDGEIYPCCSPAIFHTQLSLRESMSQSLDRTIEKLNSNLLLYIVRKEGFSWFLNILKERKLLEEFEVPSEFPSVCSICGSLFNTSDKIEFFRPFMEKYYSETIKI